MKLAKSFEETFPAKVDYSDNVIQISDYQNTQVVYSGRHGAGGAKWPYGMANTGGSPALDHYLTRQNARSAVHDSPAAKAIVERFADTVVDIGLKLDPDPIAGLLGITEEQAEAWAEMVSMRFNLWAMNKKCHKAENMNFYQAQRLVQVFTQRDNDYFIRLHYSQRADLLSPLQFSFIDPSQIRGDAVTSSYGFQNNTGDGIERDADGREIAYHVYVWKGEQYKLVRIPRIGPKSGKIMMLHGFRPEYAFQGRGYSTLSHILQDVENLQDFSLSQIKKAINQSSIAMYVKPSKDAPASNPMEDYEGVTPAEMLGANPTAAPEGEEPESLSTMMDWIPMPEATFTAPGSIMMANLKEGEDLGTIQDTAPTQQYDRFVDSFCAYLAASVGMPIEVLLMRFAQNYSASRATLILFWRIAQIKRAEEEADFLNPIYEIWLALEIAAGRITAPGWSDPRLRAAWLNNNWIGAPMPNIDPLRTAKADQTYAALGAQDLDRIAIQLNGSRGKTNRAKLTKQYGELPEPPWNKKGG